MPSDGHTPTLAAIALGSNQGDRATHIRAGIDALSALPGTNLLAASNLREYPAWGPVPQGPYLNACVLVRTGMDATVLLEHLLDIERSRGRDRASAVRFGPRPLDLDLLLYGDTVIDLPGLTVPHPRMHERRFVLEPLAEIAPDLVVPGLGRTVRTLLDRLGAAS